MGSKSICPSSVVLDSVNFKIMHRDLSFVEDNFFDVHGFTFHRKVFKKDKPIFQTRVYNDVEFNNRTLFETNYTFHSFSRRVPKKAKDINKKSLDIKKISQYITDESYLIKIHGIKSYDDLFDQFKSDALDKTATFCYNYDLDFCIKEIAISFDIEINSSHGINNFFLANVVEKGSNKIYDPSKPSKKSKHLYDLWNLKGPVVKGQLYGKEYKEMKKRNNNIGKEIYRCEITLTNLEDIMVIDDYKKFRDEFYDRMKAELPRRKFKEYKESRPRRFVKDYKCLITHIENVLNEYRLFYFDDPETHKDVKKTYQRNNMKPRRCTMFLDKCDDGLLDKIYDQCTHEIQLNLTDNIKAFIKDTLRKNDDPLETEDEKDKRMLEQINEEWLLQMKEERMKKIQDGSWKKGIVTHYIEKLLKEKGFI